MVLLLDFFLAIFSLKEQETGQRNGTTFHVIKINVKIYDVEKSLIYEFFYVQNIIKQMSGKSLIY